MTMCQRCPYNCGIHQLAQCAKRNLVYRKYLEVAPPARSGGDIKLRKLFILAIAAVSTTALATEFGPGASFAIPDNTTAAPGVGSSSIAVATGGGIITSINWVKITFSVNHTWRGDLVARLIAPNGDDVHLFSRVGSTTQTGVGSSTDLSGPYRFFATGASFAANAATPTTPGDYARSSHAGGAAILADRGVALYDADDYTVFGGDGIDGSWTLRISDHAGGDTGTVGSWSFDADYRAVPEPATMAVLGMGVAALLRRRRK